MNYTRQYPLCLWAILAITGSLSGSSAVLNAADGAVSPQAASVGALGTAVKCESAPAAKKKVVLVYPYEMLMSGRSGWAEASFVIDYAGRPLFTNPKEASDRSFAKALIAMIEASQYVPELRNNHTVMSPASERYQFLGEDSLDGNARRVLTALRKGRSGFTAASDLDARPKVVRQDAPVYPRALKDDGLTGQAEIEFVVDRDGRVLFPRIVSASHEDFGWAAATAVAQWRFTSPERAGQKVDTLMRVPILFDARKLASGE